MAIQRESESFAPQTAISMVFPIVKTIARRGLSVEQFLKETGLDPALLQNAEQRISTTELEQLLIKAAEYTNDPYFGLHQGEMTEIADLGILGYVMMHSGTLAGALDAYRRYNIILCSSYQLDWTIQGDHVLIRLFLEGSERMSRHCAEDMASSLYHLLSKLSSQLLSLQEVHFTHESPSDLAPYQAVFGLIPSFNAEQHLLVMNKEVLDYPILYSDSRLLGMFEGMARQTSEGMSRTATFSEQVTHWIKECLPAYMPTLQQAAEHFGVSGRTIQHRLKEEQTTYQSLTNSVRQELAEHLLSTEQVAIAEIAYILQYSEPSAFQNAFKKWIGVTPGQYRERVRGE